ncbi:hypothetical protein EGH24_13880 [Halonotius terrestris]|uniref:Uncharacterized protein n=1 Tax=Halonotius terrestris TaxID=2487750 RepID=A0A8J8TBN0_9EURY|nr:hypothetical protein [Halonotius terrestris]TQQ78607.1 hypothetical protein EGH24_13880 [Halonotius terrestris]
MRRRTLLAAGVSGAAGLVAGPLLASEQATADAAVSLGTLDVRGAETTTADGTVSDVTARVSAAWKYDLPAGSDPDSWQLRLLVSDGDATATLDSATGDAKYLSASGEADLAGSLLATDVFSAEVFAAPDAGQTREVPVGLGLGFKVTSPDDRVLAAASHTDTATVAITHDSYDATLHGSAGGSGSLTVSE